MSVAGICTGTATMRGCEVTMPALTVTATALLANTGIYTIVSGIGYGQIKDCVVDIAHIKVATSSVTGRSFYVGGILANTSNVADYSVERSRVRFDKLEVTAIDNAPVANASYVGGLAGQGNVSHSSIQGELTITVTVAGYPFMGLRVAAWSNTLLSVWRQNTLS